MLRWLCVALLFLSCSGGGTRRVVYEHSQVAFRASTYSSQSISQIVILPLAYIETENIEGIGAPTNWETRTQEHLLAAFTAENLKASIAQVAAPPSYNEVVEMYLQRDMGTQEEALIAANPDASKTYLAYKTKIAELHPREWARKWNEFANTFASSPFVPMAKARAEALKELPPPYPPEVLAAFSQTASHIAIPASLKWVRSQLNSSGAEHQVYAAEIELEILDAKTGQVVWRGHGIHKEDDKTPEPLDVALQKAAVHAVKAAL
jgi:hypothetical protein